MAALEETLINSPYPRSMVNGGTFIGTLRLYRDLKVDAFRVSTGYQWYVGEDCVIEFSDVPRKEIKHLVFVSRSGETSRFHLLQNLNTPVPLLAIQHAFQESLGKRFQVEFLLNSRFKINVNDRWLVVNQHKLAHGTMNSNAGNWQGKWYGKKWERQLGEDFTQFMLSHFDLAWAHKVVCQRRGEYQFLPNVALFFDSTNDLVIKLINRPNDKDSCEGFYVGKVFGKGFGYHIDGNHEKIPNIDSYFKHALTDIVGCPLPEGAFQAERFVVDIHYRVEEDRWVLMSSVGEIGQLVKGVKPENTCSIRKYITWTHDVFGEPIDSIPLLENLLVNAFHRSYCRNRRQGNL